MQPGVSHDRQLTSASLFARVSARAVTASCDAKPLLLSSAPPPLPSGVTGIAGTRSRNKACAPFADLTVFYTGKVSNSESMLILIPVNTLFMRSKTMG